MTEEYWWLIFFPPTCLFVAGAFLSMAVGFVYGAIKDRGRHADDQLIIKIGRFIGRLLNATFLVCVSCLMALVGVILWRPLCGTPVIWSITVVLFVAGCVIPPLISLAIIRFLTRHDRPGN
jgi:hypothetical protein